MKFGKYVSALTRLLVQAEYDDALTQEERDALAGVRLALIEAAEQRGEPVYGKLSARADSISTTTHVRVLA